MIEVIGAILCGLLLWIIIGVIYCVVESVRGEANDETNAMGNAKRR